LPLKSTWSDPGAFFNSNHFSHRSITMTDSTNTPTVGGKEPGQRNWPSALSRIPEPFRAAVQEHAAEMVEAEKKRTNPTDPDNEMSVLEHKMLMGGRALSMITSAAYLPYHLLQGEEIQAACDVLSARGPLVLLEQMRERIQKAQVLLLIGDEPSVQSVNRAVQECLKSGEIKTLIAGPGILMENALRAWALENNWPDAHLRSIDGSMGEVWHAQAGEAIDEAVAQLFDVHLPTRVALLHPVRLPATQVSIEQASHRKVPMTEIKFEKSAALKF
jgi:hypothetical protein